MGLVVFGGSKLRCWWFSGLSCAGCFGYPAFLFSGCGCVALVMFWCGVVWWFCWCAGDCCTAGFCGCAEAIVFGGDGVLVVVC